MRVVQSKSKEDLERLTRAQFHQLWFNDAMTDSQMAVMFNTDKYTVKAKRKQLGLNMFNCGMLRVMGGKQFQDDKELEKKNKKLSKKILRDINKKEKKRGFRKV